MNSLFLLAGIAFFMVLEEVILARSSSFQINRNQRTID